MPCLYILLFKIKNKIGERLKKQFVPKTNKRYYATEDGHIFDCINNKFIAENKSKRG